MDQAIELNTHGKTNKFIAGTRWCLAEGVFVGDVEKVGTFGDLIGGPTAVDDLQTTMQQRIIKQS